MVLRNPLGRGNYTGDYTGEVGNYYTIEIIGWYIFFNKRSYIIIMILPFKDIVLKVMTFFRCLHNTMCSFYVGISTTLWRKISAHIVALPNIRVIYSTTIVRMTMNREVSCYIVIPRHFAIHFLFPWYGLCHLCLIITLNNPELSCRYPVMSYRIACDLTGI